MKNKKLSPPGTPQRTQQNKNTHQPEPVKSDSLTVVGIGASAGGLEALQAFFASIPSDAGLAFVVITHLHPEHESHLAEILQLHTGMPVIQVAGEMHVEPNHVYVMPPNRRMLMKDSTLDLAEFDQPRGLRTPIDQFFRSLAKGHRNTVGIILSGSGTDGAVGIKAIKEEGGLLMVQDPLEASFDGMPRAAIATGLVDVVLPVRKLPDKLVEFIRYPTVLPSDPNALTTDQVEALKRILSHVEARTGHDFSRYKQATVLRRVQRRIQLTGQETLESYYNYMRSNINEASALFYDMLIGVTNFFRDTKSWEALDSKVIPAIFKDKQEGDPIRVWSIGCSTGEEPYSLAILLIENAERLERRYELQVFATDLDENSLIQARDGTYPSAIEADVSPERLQKFFNRKDHHYQVKRELRDMVLFTNHNVLRDPPFSRVDLIVCRNLLIYLQRDMHENVLDVFHYALNPDGYLFLGSSESADSARELFHALDKPHRIYKAKPWPGELPHVPAMPLKAARSLQGGVFTPARAMHRRFVTGMPPLEEQHLKALESFGPPSIWVDENFLILNISETAGRFLLQPGGPITSDLLRLVRPELQLELSSALFYAFEHDKSTLSQPVNVSFNGSPHRIIISVRPEKDSQESRKDNHRRALVVFLEDESEIYEEPQDAAGIGSNLLQNEKMMQLEQEVQYLRERLQGIMEEYNSSNEEMKAANEELQSINEEYRSATEELETSKEELQSVNEELQTVNSELRNKLEEVSRTNSDMENLMDATRIATLFLDRNLKIKRYSPGMEDLFNIRATDRGRLISDLTHKLGYFDLVHDAQQVLLDLVTIERETSSPDGGWLLIRLRPYRTLDDRIEGVVVSFVDVTEVKKAQRVRLDYESFYTLFHANPIPTLLTRLEDDVVMNVNQAFLDYLETTRENVVGHTAQEFNLGLNLQSKERIILTTQLLKDSSIRNFEEEITLPSGKTKTVLTSLQYIHVENMDAILSTFIDITDRVLAERQIRNLSIQLTTAEQEERNRISRMLHDDLQQRIFAIKMQLENLEESIENNDLEAVKLDFAKLEDWLRDSIRITRQLSTDLGPLDLQKEGLTEVLLWLSSQMKDQYGLEVEVDSDDTQTRFENHLQIVLFHAIRELLFNVVKHAGTLQANVSIHKENGERMVIQVSDAGAGFNPHTLSRDENVAHGLAFIRQRLTMFGCNLNIESAPERGTRVTIDCPLRAMESRL